MNENIDLTKILKDCPKGWKLYSPIFGEMKFSKIGDNDYSIIVTQDCHTASFTKEGFYYADVDGECLLFPSKDQRDWSKFTAPWYKKEMDTIAGPEKQGEQEEPQVYETEDGTIITYSEIDGYKFVEPKFKVGDKIVNILMKYMVGQEIQGIISEITDNKYVFTDGSYIFISSQDSWELVPNKKPKFDPKTLNPFDKVLVFDSDRPWTPLMFSYLEYSLNYPRMQCFDFAARKVIPYNKETEHLLGTYNEAPEFYRYWED